MFNASISLSNLHHIYLKFAERTWSCHIPSVSVKLKKFTLHTKFAVDVKKNYAKHVQIKGSCKNYIDGVQCRVLCRVEIV